LYREWVTGKKNRLETVAFFTMDGEVKTFILICDRDAQAERREELEQDKSDDKRIG
jgi:hypothetical protein